jgi:hypothetical protein
MFSVILELNRCHLIYDSIMQKNFAFNLLRKGPCKVKFCRRVEYATRVWYFLRSEDLMIRMSSFALL